MAEHFRRHGYAIGPDALRDATQALAAVDLLSPREVRDALRCLFARSPEEWQRFDQVWEALWRPGGIRASPPVPPPSRPSRPSPPAPGLPPAPEGRWSMQVAAPSRRLAYSPTWGERFAVAVQSGESLRRSLVLAGRLRQWLGYLPGRRWRPASRGQVDLRRTVRRALPRGGQVWELARRRPRARSTPVVWLLDLSGSMRAYGSFFLTLAYATARLGPTETFAFGTALVRLTAVLARPGVVGRPLAGLEPMGGGTRLAAALRELVEAYGSCVSPQGALILASDGLDGGSPVELGLAMARLQARVGKVVWMNPLALEEGYRPERTAYPTLAPWVDVHWAVGNLRTLAAALGVPSPPLP